MGRPSRQQTIGDSWEPQRVPLSPFIHLSPENQLQLKANHPDYEVPLACTFNWGEAWGGPIAVVDILASSGARSVLELRAQPGGEEAWNQVAERPLLQFSLRPGSLSRSVFDAYQESRNSARAGRRGTAPNHIRALFEEDPDGFREASRLDLEAFRQRSRAAGVRYRNEELRPSS